MRMEAITDRSDRLFRECTEKEKRISYVLLEKNEGISENTNGAIRIADGDFIMFSDHDDTVAPNALYEIVKSAE